MVTRRAHVRKAWFAASRFSSVRARRAREGLRDRVRNISGRASSAVVRILPAPRVRDSRRVREWVCRRAVRHRLGPASLQDVLVRRAVRDSRIFRVIKKAR
jgi:hypothetical protein